MPTPDPDRQPFEDRRREDRRRAPLARFDREPGEAAASILTNVSAMQLRLATSPCIVHEDASETALNLRDAVLLAWLALEGPTARTRLAVLLWPGSTPDVAGNALRQRLFQLRRQLGVELVSGHAVLALVDGLAHDLGDSQQVLGDSAVMNRVVQGFTQYTRYLAINMQRVPDLAVRQALNYAIDRENFLKAYTPVAAEPSTTILSPTTLGFVSFNAYDGGPSGNLEKAKEQSFEETPSYLALRRVYREQIGSPMPSAAVPELELKSPKLRRGYSTAAYARNVLRHHRACVQRLRGD